MTHLLSLAIVKLGIGGKLELAVPVEAAELLVDAHHHLGDAH